MYFYKFINSKDIREYHKIIGYEYSPVEAAWLINFSKVTSLMEKIEGWEWIIAHMADTPIEERPCCDYRPSLHVFLREYISFCKRHHKALEHNRSPKLNGEDEIDLWCRSFDGMYMEFPLPFKKGDVLTYFGTDPNNIERSGDIFILDHVMTKECFGNKKASYWDTSDMIIYGYGQDENGSIWYDHFSDYMDMEFYTCNLTKEYALLKAVSNTLKGNINLEFLLQCQKKILTGSDDVTGVFDSKTLRMAGLEWEDKDD